MFGWEFPPHHSGGLGTACWGICKAMNRRDVELIFVLPRRQDVPEGFANFAFAGLDQVVFEPVESLLYPYIVSDMMPSPGEVSYGPDLHNQVMSYAKKGRDIAKRHSYDIIHAHDWLAFPAGLEAKRISGKPLVVHVHATEFDRTGGLGVNQAVYEIEKAGLDGSDGIIAISERTKRMIINHYGISGDKIRVIHNGIDHEEVVMMPESLKALKQTGKKIVLFAGRITLQKGPDYFIETAREVLSNRRDVYFIVAGAGDMERVIVSRVASLGIADRVLFAGFLRGRDLHALYQSADIFVLSSVSEPFGLTPLEALANGTPVIVSKQSGVAEVLNSAIKVDFWDTVEMSKQINRVLDDDSYRDYLIRLGQPEVQNLTWHKAVAGYLDFYRQFIPAKLKL